jgi:hypothetical protein
MNVAVFWDVVPFNLRASQRFGRRYYLHIQGRKLAQQETSVYQETRQRKVVINSSEIHTTRLCYQEDGKNVEHLFENG